MSQDRARLTPTSDTSPIPFEKLLEDQQDVIKDVNQWLTSMYEDARVHAPGPSLPKPPYPWPPLIEKRTNRNLVLDGQRGTGKTSLMLTLLLGWQRDAQQVADRGNIERRLFDGMGQRVRPLRPLDFNPLPEHLHPYTLFVQAFKPLVNALESDLPRASGVWKPLQEEMTIEAQWKELYRSAELGWQTLRTSSKDIDQHAFDSLEQDTAWLDLEVKWTSFVDRLLKTLEDRGMIPAGGLLVLPVDDLDLHPVLSDDLLLALRKVWHRRIAILLTGHVKHLEEAVTRRLVARSFSSSGRIQPPQPTQMQALERLAADLVQKALPFRERIPARLLSLLEAWRLVYAPKDPLALLREQASTANGTEKHLSTIADWLKVALKAWQTRTIRIRDAAQVSPDEPLDTLFELMQTCRDDNGNQLLRRLTPFQWRWSDLLPNQTIHVWTNYSGYTSGRVITPDKPMNEMHHTVGVAHGDLSCRTVTYQTEKMTARDAAYLFGKADDSINTFILEISALTSPPDLLSVLLFLEDHNHVDGVIREDSQSSFAAAFECQLKSDIRLTFPLPTPMQITPGFEHDELTKKWNERIPTIAKRGPDSTLWLWIWFFLEEPLTELGIQAREDFLEHSRITPALWKSLLDHLARQIRHPLGYEPTGLARWALRSIPTLAAPEYGLSPETQQQLLDWRRNLGGERSWASVCSELDRERRASLRRSVLFFSSITDEQIARVDSIHVTSTPEGLVATVEDEIRSEYPHSAWLSKEKDQAPAVDTIDLLNLPVSPQQTIANIAYGANAGYSSDRSIPLGRLFHISVVGGYRETNWATIQASRLLRTTSDRARFVEVAVRMDANTATPADFMAQIWRLLTEMAGNSTSDAGARDWASWVTTADATTLAYGGPSLVIVPTARQHTSAYRFTGQSHDEWSLDAIAGGMDPRERDHISLLGWLLLCQSYDPYRLLQIHQSYHEPSLGFERIELRVPSILSFDGVALPQPPHKVWRTQEGVRHAWQRMCRLANRRYTATPEGQQRPQEEWLLASWLVMNFEAMAHGEPRTLLSYPLNVKELRQSMLSAKKPNDIVDWLLGVGIVDDVFGPEILPAWQEILEGLRSQ